MQADQAAIEHAPVRREQVEARLMEDLNARHPNARRLLETIRPAPDQLSHPDHVDLEE